MSNLDYCSNCGAPNEIRDIDGLKRKVCPSCGSIHYENPRPAVTVVLMKENEILLVKRAVPPAFGRWCLPGGFIELEEAPAAAAQRELLEETGLTADGMEFLGICPSLGGLRGDLLVLGYVATRYKGILQAGDDAQDVQFFPLEDLPPVAFHCHREIIQVYLDYASEGRPPRHHPVGLS